MAPFIIEDSKVEERGNASSAKLFEKFGNAEFQHLLLFLDMTDLSRLHIAISAPLRQRLLELTTELRHAPYKSRPRVTSNLTGPATLFSHFPALCTLKLRNFCYVASNASAFAHLPPTLIHFEVACNFPSSSKGLLQGLDFAKSFPRLESCVVSARLHSWHWMITLPPTLLALVSYGTSGEDKIFSFVNGTIDAPVFKDDDNGHVSDEDEEAEGNPILLMPQTCRPFPSLLILEINSPPPPPGRARRRARNINLAPCPSLSSLPPSLTRFSWMAPYTGDDFDHILEREKRRGDGEDSSLLSVLASATHATTAHPFQPSHSPPGSSETGAPVLNDFFPNSFPHMPSRAVLRSLRIYATPQNNFFDSAQTLPLEYIHIASDDWRSDIPLARSLTTLRLSGHMVDLSLEDSLFARLAKRGIQLHTLEFRAIHLPEGDASEALSLASVVLASVKVIHVHEATKDAIRILPADLEEFKVVEYEDDGPWGEEEIRRFPPKLTSLSLADVTLDLGLLPLLPRSLLHLELALTNGGSIGTNFISPEMRSDGLPYDSIAPTDNIMFGLPPNLRYLHVNSSLSYDSTSGLFLPRSLLRLSSHHLGSISIRDTSESRFRFIGQFVGLSERPTPKDQLIQRVVSFFPPGCICSLLLDGCSLIELEPFVAAIVHEM